MIITRVPFRVSFIGGSSDYPAWFTKHGGLVISTTIDKYCYITARFLPPFYGIRHRIVWSHHETVASAEEILHPCVKAAFQVEGVDNWPMGLEIHHQGDLPARSGMGSSSAFAVGLLKALNELKSEMSTRRIRFSNAALAKAAIYLEQDVIGDCVGCQDQIAVTYGGFNLIRFNKGGGWVVAPIVLPSQVEILLESRLMLFFIGTTRLASGIAQSVVSNFDTKKTTILKMMGLAEKTIDYLKRGYLRQFGELLHEGWMLKRSTSPRVSTKEIDDIYSRAKKAGAIGGKLLGAGGAGHMLFYVNEEDQDAVKEALSDLVYVPFKFEKEGCKIIYAHQP